MPKVQRVQPVLVAHAGNIRPVLCAICSMTTGAFRSYLLKPWFLPINRIILSTGGCCLRRSMIPENSAEIQVEMRRFIAYVNYVLLQSTGPRVRDVGHIAEPWRECSVVCIMTKQYLDIRTQVNALRGVSTVFSTN